MKLSHEGRWLIIVFCLWHMAAVGLYSIPASAKDPASVWLKNNAVPVVRPYLLITSQWQQWNMFSPDPMRRVEDYQFSIKESGVWQPSPYLSPSISGFFRDSNLLSILRRLSEDDNLRPVMERLMQTSCSELSLARGTELQLNIQIFLLPGERQTPMSWLKQKEDWENWKLFTTTCP